MCHFVPWCFPVILSWSAFPMLPLSILLQCLLMSRPGMFLVSLILHEFVLCLCLAFATSVFVHLTCFWFFWFPWSFGFVFTSAFVNKACLLSIPYLLCVCLLLGPHQTSYPLNVTFGPLHQHLLEQFQLLNQVIKSPIFNGIIKFRKSSSQLLSSHFTDNICRVPLQGWKLSLWRRYRILSD